MKIYAVIPAAGKGTRLKYDKPKIMVEIMPGLSIWKKLIQTLSPLVERVIPIMSPAGKPYLVSEISEDEPCVAVEICLQEKPIGMGDAIFQASSSWYLAEHILVMWGDQPHVSGHTLKRAIAIHASLQSPCVTIPVVRLNNPYVEYIFNDLGQLVDILQNREGDLCSHNGLSDVGTFLLSTQGLNEAWQNYLLEKKFGNNTGEINFLPFLVFLSLKCSWTITTLEVEDLNEARGINTVEDLLFFQGLYDEQQ